MGKTRWSIVGMVVAGLAIPALASARGGNNDPNVVHACINNGSKIVRIVEVGGSCLPPETPAHWDIQGPAGTNGIDGSNGTNGTNGVDGTNATRADGPCYGNDAVGAGRFFDCGNGTVTDTVTGLIWLKQTDCLANASWADANRAAAGLKAGDCSGLTDHSSPGDWRLPTKAEWEATIGAVALGCKFPDESVSLTNDAGTGCQSTGLSSFAGVVSGNYWLSTAIEGGPNYAWIAGLDIGDVSNDVEVGTLRVWPVRGGPR